VTQHVPIVHVNMEMIQILVLHVLLIYICVEEDRQQLILVVFQTVAWTHTHPLGFNQGPLENSKPEPKLLPNINAFYVPTIYLIV